MRTICIQILITLSFQILLAQEKVEKVLLTSTFEYKSQIDLQDVKGNKKNVFIVVYSVDENDTTKNIENTNYTINCNYDTTGNLTRKIYTEYRLGVPNFTSVYYQNEKCFETIEFDYDNSYFLKESQTSVNKKKSILNTIRMSGENEETDYVSENYTRKKRGKLLITTTTLDKHDKRELSKTKYNKAKKPIERKRYYCRKLWLRESWNYYDDKTIKSNEIKYYDDKTMTMHYIKKYNTKGNETEYIYNDTKHNSSSFHTKNKYDTTNHLVSSEKFDNDGIMSSKTCYWYNEKGQLLKETTTDKNNIVVNKTDYLFDRDGNLNKRRYCDLSRPKENCVLFQAIWGKKDTNGNWLEVTEYLDSLPKMITTRKIEYYTQKLDNKQ